MIMSIELALKLVYSKVIWLTEPSKKFQYIDKPKHINHIIL